MWDILQLYNWNKVKNIGRTFQTAPMTTKKKRPKFHINFRESELQGYGWYYRSPICLFPLYNGWLSETSWSSAEWLACGILRTIKKKKKNVQLKVHIIYPYSEGSENHAWIRIEGFFTRTARQRLAACHPVMPSLYYHQIYIPFLSPQWQLGHHCRIFPFSSF